MRQQICSSSKYAPDVIFPNQMCPTHICLLNKHIILCKSIVFVCTYVLLNYWRRLVVIDIFRVLELKTLILNIPHIYTLTKTIRKVDDMLKTTILNWISTIFKFWNSRFDLILAFFYQQPMPVSSKKTSYKYILVNKVSIVLIVMITWKVKKRFH